MDIKELEKRITRLEDIEAIKQLKARYCEICDDFHNPDRITTIFAEDGIWESEEFGTARGHDEIRELFKKFRQLFSFTQHNIMNPIIEVNGNRARGTWYFHGNHTYRENGESNLFACRYEDDYVKINGEWKYQHLRLYLRMTSPNQVYDWNTSE